MHGEIYIAVTFFDSLFIKTKENLSLVLFLFFSKENLGCDAEVYLGPFQTSITELFAKKINSFCMLDFLQIISSEKIWLVKILFTNAILNMKNIVLA